MIVIDLPGLPRGKGRPRFSTRNGFARAHTDPQTASYEGALRMAASVAMVGLEPLQGPLSMSVVATFPVPASWSKKKQAGGAVRLGGWPTGRPDVDNLTKAAADSLNIDQVYRGRRADHIRIELLKQYGRLTGLADRGRSGGGMMRVPRPLLGIGGFSLGCSKELKASRPLRFARSSVALAKS